MLSAGNVAGAASMSRLTAISATALVINRPEREWSCSTSCDGSGSGLRGTMSNTQNIGTVWGQIRVSTINLDITEAEFQQIVHRMAQATEDLLGPESDIRKRYDKLKGE